MEKGDYVYRMTYQEARELASDAFRHFYHNNREDDNLFAHDNLYRRRWASREEADRLHYSVGVFLFDRECEERLLVYNELVSRLMSGLK